MVIEEAAVKAHCTVLTYHHCRLILEAETPFLVFSKIGLASKHCGTHQFRVPELGCLGIPPKVRKNSAKECQGSTWFISDKIGLFRSV